jgi:hypothetical protein
VARRERALHALEERVERPDAGDGRRAQKPRRATARTPAVARPRAHPATRSTPPRSRGLVERLELKLRRAEVGADESSCANARARADARRRGIAPRRFAQVRLAPQAQSAAEDTPAIRDSSHAATPSGGSESKRRRATTPVPSNRAGVKPFARTTTGSPAGRSRSCWSLSTADAQSPTFEYFSKSSA